IAMDEPRYYDSGPGWARSAKKRTPVDEPPTIGLALPSAPRLPTRIIPQDDGRTISALSLCDAVDTTQRIVNYASYEAVNGVHLGFTDLRSTEAQPALRLAKLRIEPFEDGSFVIPATLPEETLPVEDA